MLHSLKKVYSLFPEKDRFKFFVLFCMMVIASILEVLGIGMIPVFLSVVATPDTILEYPIVGDILENAGIVTHQSLIVTGSLVLIAVYIFKNAYLAWYMYLKMKFVENRGVYLQNRLFHAYMTAPYTFYIKRNSAELLRNVTHEVEKIISGTIMPMLELLLKMTMFIFIIAMLMVFEPLITVVTILFMGGGGYFFLRYTKDKTDEYGSINMTSRQQMNKAVLEGLGGFKDARVLNREKVFLDKYNTNATISKAANVYRYLAANLPRPFIETLMVIGILAITLIMVVEGRPYSSIIPVMALFGASAVKLMPIISVTISQATSIRYNSFAVHAVYEDLHLLENEYNEFRREILDDSDKITLNSRIELKSVTFEYPDSDEQAVQDLSLTIEKGRAVAIVGPSGAGKTTLVDLILGLLEPRKGSIEVDGVNIHGNIRGWMKNVGYISQSIYLLDDTIRRNITFGIAEEEIDEIKLANAIQAAQLEELIERLPKGDQTIVGERGIRLSGGQQQRISIARALYNNPQVLIMDEATSALDNITEKFVIEAIEQLRGDRTIIMIAHRLTTVKNCDTIFLLQKGRVTGQGTYDELLATNAEFRKLSLVDD